MTLADMGGVVAITKRGRLWVVRTVRVTAWAKTLRAAMAACEVTR